MNNERFCFICVCFVWAFAFTATLIEFGVFRDIYKGMTFFVLAIALNFVILKHDLIYLFENKENYEISGEIDE